MVTSFFVVLSVVLASMFIMMDSIFNQSKVMGLVDTNVNVVSVCGDNVKQGTEECDGSDFGGSSCTSLGYISGTLSCNANCTNNTSQCSTGSSSCGNGFLNSGEECDGSNLNNATCESLGYASGPLACYNNCTFDKSECIAPPQVTPTFTPTPDPFQTGTLVPTLLISATPTESTEDTPSTPTTGIDLGILIGSVFDFFKAKIDDLSSQGSLNLILICTFSSTPFLVSLLYLIRKKKLKI
ncbi:MAG TPA: hypothetical protein VJC17_00575 [Candidatus Dojkabacteria bacterium]|nr:hypothetical protein [Candidatus Dojkabacteria bacterium]